MPNRVQAKAALDAVIKKSRVHLYKPIQIAEIYIETECFRIFTCWNLRITELKASVGETMFAKSF